MCSNDTVNRNQKEKLQNFNYWMICLGTACRLGPTRRRWTWPSPSAPTLPASGMASISTITCSVFYLQTFFYCISYKRLLGFLRLKSQCFMIFFLSLKNTSLLKNELGSSKLIDHGWIVGAWTYQPGHLSLGMSTIIVINEWVS